MNENWTLVAGEIGPWDPPGLLGEIRKGVIRCLSVPAGPGETHKEWNDVVADRVICLRSLHDTVRELENWRAAFGGTFEEVADRFTKGDEEE